MVLNQIMKNHAIWSAILAWAIAQGIKFVITYWYEKKIDMTKFWSSGGMPSSHSALVMALSVAVGRSVGFDSPIFAISIIVGMVVMYDAVGVRQAAGKHAKALNMILLNSDLHFEEQLKELLGHTPLQVFAGAVLGIIVGLLY